jgi:hypothetical protein
MDPLDQRLTDAGTAWRQAQPEPPDLDPMVALLDRRRSRVFPSRLALVFVAGLLLLAAVAVAPGVGGIFRGSTAVPPVTASASPVPTSVPSQATTTPAPTASAPSQPSDVDRATALLDSYEAALVAGKWQTAFDMLAPTSLVRASAFSAYAAERAAYFESVAGRYTLGVPTRQVDWTSYAPLIAGADVSRAYLIEVDYPALSGNNAGYEQFVVAPDANANWRIWPVR